MKLPSALASRKSDATHPRPQISRATRTSSEPSAAIESNCTTSPFSDASPASRRGASPGTIDIKAEPMGSVIGHLASTTTLPSESAATERVVACSP